VKALAAIEIGAGRFNLLSVRERVLIVVAAVAAIVALWDMLLMQPLDAKRKTLTAEVDTLQSGIAAMSQAMEVGRATNPTMLALGQIKAAEQALAEVNSELESTSAGLLPPQRPGFCLQLYGQTAVRCFLFFLWPCAAPPPVRGDRGTRETHGWR